MPINDFSGDTFVAFLDISGFKEMMKNATKAIEALNCLNQTGYDVLGTNNNINGFFISDCGILFVNGNNGGDDQLLELLNVIEQINRNLINNDIMLTTSIAYGDFSYHQRKEYTGINKIPIYGNAYVNAFLDNEAAKPKIKPGQCRIIKNNFPDINLSNFNRLIKKRNYYYFYWMVENSNEINEFETIYNDSYNLKYSGMLQALKRNNNQ